MTLRKGKSEYPALYALSFVLTAALVLALYALCGVAPFGDGSLLFSDAGTQYVSIWAYFRDALLGRQDFSYALEKTLGGGALGLFSYYAASPFNLLFLLFPAEKLPLAAHLIILLKLCCCSLSLAVFFRHSSGLRPASLLCTCAYALCGYNVVYFWSTMWLDGVLLLPLVALGLRRVHEGRSPWLYIFSLAAAIFTCFYTGYMLCLFSLLYFLYLALSAAPVKRAWPVFCASSLAAGGLSAILLLPALLSMRGGKQQPFGDLITGYYGEIAVRVNRLLARFGLGAVTLGPAHVLVLLALMLLLLAAALWLVLRSRRSFRFKLIALLLPPLLLALFDLLVNRYAFFLHKLFLGAAGWAEISNGKPNLYVGLLPPLLALWYFLDPKQKERERLASMLLLTALLASMRFFAFNLVWHGFTRNACFNYRYSFVFSFFLLSLANQARPRLALSRPARALACLALAGAQIASLLIPACITVRNLQEAFAPSVSAFEAGSLAMQRRVATVKEADPSLFRAALGGDINGPLQYNFNGATSFTSTASRADIGFLQKLGLASDDFAWVSGVYGRSRAFDSLVGIQYLTDPAVDSGLTALPGGDLFRNPSALPLAFPADRAAVNTALDSADAFENLNRAYRALAPELDTDVFLPAEILDREVVGLSEQGEDLYRPEGEPESACIRYTLRSQSADPLYLWLKDIRDCAADVRVNGSTVIRAADEYSWHMICLGRYAPGETLSVELRFDAESGQSLRDRPVFRHESAAALAACHAALTDAPCATESVSDTRFATRVRAEDGQYLVYTIPYEGGWRVRVDGSRVPAERAFGYFLAVPLTAGEHSVELRYVPEGLIPGAVISGLTLLTLAAAVMLSRQKRKKKGL